MRNIPACFTPVLRVLGAPMALCSLTGLLSGCAAGDTADFSISPDPVEFGEVDFSVETPDEGYTPIAVTLYNNGVNDVTLGLADFNEDYLCVVGYSHDALPGTMGVVAPASSYVLNFAVCGYLPGERDTEVSTAVTVSTDSTPSTLSIPVTFTPVLPTGDSG
jgi:hypothetical protein